MKIENDNRIPAAGLGRTEAPRHASEKQQPAAPAPSAGATKVELSARARELRATLETAKKAPDVREDVVADVRQRIADGRYRIDPDTIATRLIDRKA